MKLALFGGRFDPVHNGHLAVAKEILKVKAADEVWFSVENQHQWRPIVASVEDRKKMLELAIEEISSQFTVDSSQKAYSSSESEKFSLRSNSNRPEQGQDNEKRDSSATPQNDKISLKKKLKIDLTPVKLRGLTETISVIRELRKTIQDDIFFVVGSDQLPTFPKWTHWEELQKEVQFLIVARKGFPLENIPSNGILLEDPNYIPLDDSATQIRERIKRGQSISDLVPKKVEEYIIERKLYR